MGAYLEEHQVEVDKPVKLGPFEITISRDDGAMAPYENSDQLPSILIADRGYGGHMDVSVVHNVAATDKEGIDNPFNHSPLDIDGNQIPMERWVLEKIEKLNEILDISDSDFKHISEEFHERLEEIAAIEKQTVLSLLINNKAPSWPRFLLDSYEEALEESGSLKLDMIWTIWDLMGYTTCHREVGQHSEYLMVFCPTMKRMYATCADEEASLQAHMDELVSWAEGECFGYSVTHDAPLQNASEIDSCWGYYGFDNVIAYLNEYLGYFLNEFHKDCKNKVTCLEQRRRDLQAERDALSGKAGSIRTVEGKTMLGTVALLNDKLTTLEADISKLYSCITKASETINNHKGDNK